MRKVYKYVVYDAVLALCSNPFFDKMGVQRALAKSYTNHKAAEKKTALEVVPINVDATEV